MAVCRIPDELLGAIVAELWNGEDWIWSSIDPYLSLEQKNKIASFKITPRMEASDKVFWAQSPSGMFTTKSAMSLLQNLPSTDASFTWKLIWSAPVQQRIRHFMFLVARDRVMVNVVRHRRHLSRSATCPRCGDDETIAHTIRDCFSFEKVGIVWEISRKLLDFHDKYSGVVTDNLSGTGGWSTILGV